MQGGSLEEAVSQKLRAGIKDISTLIVREDKAACNGSYVIVVVTEAFQGVGPLDRARLVNGLMADEIKKMHAVTVKAWTAAQWEKNKSQYE
jgi:stress-induced morphogen